MHQFIGAFILLNWLRIGAFALAGDVEHGFTPYSFFHARRAGMGASRPFHLHTDAFHGSSSKEAVLATAPAALIDPRHMYYMGASLRRRSGYGGGYDVSGKGWGGNAFLGTDAHGRFGGEGRELVGKGGREEVLGEQEEEAGMEDKDTEKGQEAWEEKVVLGEILGGQEEQAGMEDQDFKALGPGGVGGIGGAGGSGAGQGGDGGTGGVSQEGAEGMEVQVVSPGPADGHPMNPATGHLIWPVGGSFGMPDLVPGPGLGPTFATPGHQPPRFSAKHWQPPSKDKEERREDLSYGRGRGSASGFQTEGIKFPNYNGPKILQKGEGLPELKVSIKRGEYSGAGTSSWKKETFSEPNKLRKQDPAPKEELQTPKSGTEPISPKIKEASLKENSLPKQNLPFTDTTVSDKRPSPKGEEKISNPDTSKKEAASPKQRPSLAELFANVGKSPHKASPKRKDHSPKSSMSKAKETLPETEHSPTSGNPWIKRQDSFLHSGWSPRKEEEAQKVSRASTPKAARGTFSDKGGSKGTEEGVLAKSPKSVPLVPKLSLPQSKVGTPGRRSLPKTKQNVLTLEGTDNKSPQTRPSSEVNRHSGKAGPSGVQQTPTGEGTAGAGVEAYPKFQSLHALKSYNTQQGRPPYYPYHKDWSFPGTEEKQKMRAAGYFIMGNAYRTDKAWKAQQEAQQQFGGRYSGGGRQETQQQSGGRYFGGGRQETQQQSRGRYSGGGRQETPAAKAKDYPEHPSMNVYGQHNMWQGQTYYPYGEKEALNGPDFKSSMPSARIQENGDEDTKSDINQAQGQTCEES
ncbi:hypothetical protein MMC10_000192 [Thelotrema lepadinum]|nr:hypothetical protein [Thelotrema lepadinum]